jgi:lysine 2,3-aminomutase
MVRGIEDLRTPLSKIIDLDKQLRGTLSGFMMPAFVIDLPGGGGKRLVSTFEHYKDGVAVYSAPGLPGKKGSQKYYYYDPKEVTATAVEELRHEQEQALEQDMSLQDFTRPTVPRPGPSMPHPRQTPPFMYNPSLSRVPVAANARQVAVKPEDLAPQIGVSNWQPSSSAAAA